MQTGTVELTSKKEVKTRFGMKPTYSLKIDGTWYSCGFNDPRVSAGDEVGFESKEGTYGMEIIKGTLVKTGGGTKPVPAPAPTGAPKSTGGFGAAASNNRPFPVPALHGDRAIIRQNALGHAARICTSLLTNVYDENAELNIDKVSASVIALARKFEAYACGDLDVAMAAEMSKKAVAKAAKATVEAELGE